MATALPDQYVITGWGSEHDIGSVLDADFRRWWTPVLGPSSIALVTHLADVLCDDGEWHDSYAIDTCEIAAACGMACTSNQFRSTLTRAAKFRFLRVSDDELSVRLTFPEMHRNFRERLPMRALTSYEAARVERMLVR